MRRKSKNKIIILLLILGIGVGFAIVSTQLGVFGNISAISGTWNVYLDNVEVVDSNITINPQINANKNEVSFTANLVDIDDHAEFTVDVINDGSIDAMINSFSAKLVDSNNNELTIPSYLDLSVKYYTGESLANNQLLPAKSANAFKVVLKYKDNIDTSDVNKSDISGSYKVNIEYRRAKGTTTSVESLACYNNLKAEIDNNIVCKRATKLSYELCETGFCRNTGYSLNEQIIYGTCGTQGSSPVVGDAFDCDVDNSGTFDADERFYYISDSGSNEGYATLIYYKNVGTGAYDSSGQNYNGPVSLLNILPSTAEWSNTGLNTGITRQIKNELGENTTNNGTNTLPNYTYAGRATRLLTYQEVYDACYDGNTAITSVDSLFTKCQFLFEKAYFANTNNSHVLWWLETPHSTNNYAWNVNIAQRFVGVGNPKTYYDVRPAIEVDKTKIAY